MTRKLAVVYEADADFATATELADRMLCASIEWLDEQLLVHQRTWLRESTNGQPLTWKGMKRLALDAGIAPQGHFGGEPGLPDAANARRAILFLAKEFPDLAGIALVRDRDDQPQRRGGLEQARRHTPGPVPIVVGLAVVERECWVISGYDPENKEEAARLAGETKRLHFDPRLHSHQLTACKDDQADRSPKRVLRALTGDDWDRQRRCWQKSDLDVLRQRGAENGLADYLQEVRDRLAPLIGHVARG
jgi:hypothetical protein